MTTAVVTLDIRADCVEFLAAANGESRERNLADMLDNGQATIVNVRIEDADADAKRQANLEQAYADWRRAYGD